MIFTKVLSSAISGALLVLLALCSSGSASAAQTVICDVPAHFRHPGLLNNLNELEVVKAHIAAGEEPWATAYETMRHSFYASLRYQPHPVDIEASDFFGANALGTKQEDDDGFAAYAQSLMWVFTGDERYAANAANILNAWSATLQTHTGRNWYLQAAWAGTTLPLSAELLRATYPKWKPEEIAQFKAMLARAFLPLLHNRMAYGNRELAVINALMAIGVFNDDRAAFCEGLNHWKSYVPDYIYLSSDGPTPKRPGYWLSTPDDAALTAMNGGVFPDGNWIETAGRLTGTHDDRVGLSKQTLDQLWFNPGGPLIDGLCQETGRDLSHTELAMAAIANAAEIAWHQGIDLYTPNAKRLAAFLETHAGFRLGNPPPPGLYNGKLNIFDLGHSYEIAYSHLRYVNGIPLPQTEKLLNTALRPDTSIATVPGPSGINAPRVVGPAFLLTVWQTLTHARIN